MVTLIARIRCPSRSVDRAMVARYLLHERQPPESTEAREKLSTSLVGARVALVPLLRMAIRLRAWANSAANASSVQI
jgi:hypothetical protein